MKKILLVMLLCIGASVAHAQVTPAFMGEKKRELCLRVADAIGKTLAHPKKDPVFMKNAEVFLSLYYGQAQLLCDSMTCGALFEFRLSIKDYLDGYITEFDLKEHGLYALGRIKEEMKQ